MMGKWTGCLFLGFVCFASSHAGVFTDWPRGAEPEVVSRRLTDLFLTSAPEYYKPVGYARLADASNYGYGDRGHIHYSTVALWINALECMRLMGDGERERKLIDAWTPFYGPKAKALPKFKHVDFTIVGAVPLEIAILNGDKRAAELGLRFADSQWEEPKQEDPAPIYNATSFEERMSWWRQGYSDQTRLWIDDMYMITVLQGQAYRLTKDRKYVDRAAKEMCLYLDRIQLKDGKNAGLFYHAPDVPYVWGRGNGWMAAGMPLLLELLPGDSPHRAQIMDGYRKMMAKLLECQCADGMWNQLVGDPKSWEETSCTAMFGYGFAMGVKNGWLDEKTYGPAARKAYLALVKRLDAFGNVPDVCCGTGKKNDYQYYLDRPRVHGDPHGQAPLLWMARTFLEAEADRLRSAAAVCRDGQPGEPELVNRPMPGFRGIWYFNQPSKDEFVYKYSGGMGTYSMGHVPFGVYRKEVDRTFFCFGGTDERNSTLYHCVSFFDHKMKRLARPMIVYDKHSTDAHDNAVINVDAEGYIYLFAASHGKWRPSAVARSVKPYDISKFEEIRRDNFSYPQPWFVPGRGFLFLNTLYQAKGTELGRRADYFQTFDGKSWSSAQMLHFINDGDYQRSWQAPDGRVGVAFDQHPQGKGLNARTDLYYMETSDFGRTWRTASGETLRLPLTERDNPALVMRYAEKGKNVYVNCVKFDSRNRPLVLYIVSNGYKSGPKDGPRAWKLARWTGTAWEERDTGIQSGSNYDFGTLIVDSDDELRIVGATGPGPQLYNPGGELQAWRSHDGGRTWTFEKSITAGSARNHNYPRRPLDARPDFYAFWADGNGRRPSVSRLYFCDRDLNVYRMPYDVSADFANPEPGEVKP